MTAASDPCTSNDLLSVDAAREKIMSMVKAISGIEQLFIRDALNRVLAEPIISGINVPSFDNSAMDGYGINSRDIPAEGTRSLTILGRAMAGSPYTGTVSPGECIRIMTGAKIPSGVDTVLMQEQVEASKKSITLQSGHSPGENVRKVGEDMAKDQLILAAGKQLTPADLGVIASLGITEIRVFRKIRAAFFSTGDELVSLGQPLADGQIYDSNRYTLHGMLSRLGVEIIDMGVIPDERDAVRNAFIEASNIADVIFTSGGVSVGEADYVKQTLEELGQVNFWRMKMKPGKPLATGRVKNAVFFGLPGNPVSVMATFYQFAQPALYKMMGTQPKQPLILKIPTVTAIRKAPGRLEYQRGILSKNDVGEWQVISSGRQGSHVLTSMSKANCFVILPAESAGVSTGDLVDVQPFDGVI